MRFSLLPLALLGVATSFAGTLAMTGSSITDITDTSGYTTGWAFTTTGVTVTALGYYDSGKDGLLDAHDVGIFDSLGNLLVSATVPNGVAGTLNADWRFISITPYALGAGSYVIGGYSKSSDPITITGTATGAPGITLGSVIRYVYGGSLAFPTFGGLTYLNPNFEFNAAPPVPEPATLGLAAAALCLAAFRLRK